MEEVPSNADRIIGQRTPAIISEDMVADLNPTWTRSEHIPSDEVIISILNWKVRGNGPCSHDIYVKEIDSQDVYGGVKKPPDIFSTYAQNPRDQYVHLLTTPANNIDEIGNIGVWKLVEDDDGATPEPVKDSRLGNQVVGFKKTFVYDDSSSRGQFHGWLMTEYSTLERARVPSLNYVLCKIEKIVFCDNTEGEGEGE